MIKQKKVTKIIHLRRHNNLDFCSFSGVKFRLKKTDYIAIIITNLKNSVLFLNYFISQIG